MNKPKIDKQKIGKKILAIVLLAMMVIPTFTTLIMWIMGVI